MFLNKFTRTIVCIALLNLMFSVEAKEEQYKTFVESYMELMKDQTKPKPNELRGEKYLKSTMNVCRKGASKLPLCSLFMGKMQSELEVNEDTKEKAQKRKMQTLIQMSAQAAFKAKYDTNQIKQTQNEIVWQQRYMQGMLKALCAKFLPDEKFDAKDVLRSKALRKGDYVQLTGLIRNYELNDEYATIIGADENNPERYNVHLQGCKNSLANIKRGEDPYTISIAEANARPTTEEAFKKVKAAAAQGKQDFFWSRYEGISTTPGNSPKDRQQSYRDFAEIRKQYNNGTDRTFIEAMSDSEKTDSESSSSVAPLCPVKQKQIDTRMNKFLDKAEKRRTTRARLSDGEHTSVKVKKVQQLPQPNEEEIQELKTKYKLTDKKVRRFISNVNKLNKAFKGKQGKQTPEHYMEKLKEWAPEVFAKLMQRMKQSECMKRMCADDRKLSEDTTTVPEVCDVPDTEAEKQLEAEATEATEERLFNKQDSLLDVEVQEEPSNI